MCGGLTFTLRNTFMDGLGCPVFINRGQKLYKQRPETLVFINRGQKLYKQRPETLFFINRGQKLYFPVRKDLADFAAMTLLQSD